jgi:hypothetical protein
MVESTTKTDALAYDALPEALKAVYTPKEWAWLGWEGRQHAIDRECLPDVAED